MQAVTDLFFKLVNVEGVTRGGGTRGGGNPGRGESGEGGTRGGGNRGRGLRNGLYPGAGGSRREQDGARVKNKKRHLP